LSQSTDGRLLRSLYHYLLREAARTKPDPFSIAPETNLSTFA